MKVVTFNIAQGIYHFELQQLDTTLHSHPAIEIVKAEKGTFTLEGPQGTRKGLVFAIIDANIEHTITAEHATLALLMVESNNNSLKDFLGKKNVSLDDGLYLTSCLKGADLLFSEIKTLAQQKKLKQPSDKRIALCLKIIEENSLEYKHLIPTLTAKVFLSHSRLSHLFKAHIGISIKRYLVWSRLKVAILLFLKEPHNLTSIAHETGFFDQAHLSNSFKRLLGVSPVEAYNSRIIQS